MLSLSEIQVFAVAAETENFSKAARRLHLSQPAVSQHIRSLESYLGVQLFQRTGRGVTLTDEGRVLLKMARELLNFARHIEETVKSLEEKVVGHLVIGCTTTAGKYVLPLVASAFLHRYPNVRVTIEACNCGPILELLLAQEVHLGVSSAKVVHRDIECQPFFDDRVVLVVPTEHAFAHRSCIQPAELVRQPFIMRERGSSTCQMVQAGLAEHDIQLEDLQVAMVMGNEEAIEAAVEYGLGIAFISRLAARHGIASGRLAVVPIEGMCLERPLYVAQNSRSPKTAVQARFWSFLAEYRQELPQLLARHPLRVQDAFLRSVRAE